MDELAKTFEAHRSHLGAVAYRMLGSVSEAEDAVQETWLKLSRTDVQHVENMPAWLRTVVSRVCLDMLRTRTSRREDLSTVPDRPADDEPAAEAVLINEVGRALLVVLDTLSPAERVAFVLHDLFAVPFAQIAPIVDRSPTTTKKLASRARQRLEGTPALPQAELPRHKRVVDAFLAASRDGDLQALLEVLAPDVVRTADASLGVPPEARGARTVADETIVFGRRSQYAVPALVNGRVGVVVAPHGRLVLALTVSIDGDRISAYHVHADLDGLTVALLAGGAADHRVR